MKQVSFNVAKALKVAGYPQGNTIKCYLTSDHNQFYKEGQIVENDDGEWSSLTKCLADIPTYPEAWLWLWREKKIKLMLTPIFDEMGNDINKVCIVAPSCYIEANDPEEAIIASIDYLADNDLIK